MLNGQTIAELLCQENTELTQVAVFTKISKFYSPYSVVRIKLGRLYRDSDFLTAAERHKNK